MELGYSGVNVSELNRPGERALAAVRAARNVKIQQS
jgi:hypothetical protein